MHDRNQVSELFGVPKAMVGMIHVQALPGTAFAGLPMSRIAEQAVAEARLLVNSGFDAIMIENMHDRPYLRQTVGPEIVAGMAVVLQAVREAVDVPIGVQVLAGANRAALAVAMVGGAAFIRAENFVFAQVADEGLMPEADAAGLLRYRREMGAEQVRIFADVKKKHASHAVTADVDLADTARAAAFFGADGVVVTGAATGRAASLADVQEVSAAVELPVAIGSGLTPDNLARYWDCADVFIVGSFIKHMGEWHRPLAPDRVAAIVTAARRLREA